MPFRIKGKNVMWYQDLEKKFSHTSVLFFFGGVESKKVSLILLCASWSCRGMNRRICISSVANKKDKILAVINHKIHCHTRRRSYNLSSKSIDRKIGGEKKKTQVPFSECAWRQKRLTCSSETGAHKNGKTGNTVCICFPAIFVIIKLVQN